MIESLQKMKETIENESYFKSLCINLTNRCDTYCKYCFQSAGNKKGTDPLSFIEIKRLLLYAQSKNKDCNKFLQLTGGEVTLHKDFFNIITLALDLGYILRIQTNGLDLSSLPIEKLKILSSSKILFKISLDGWNSETHEYLRAPGTFDRVISGIQKLREYNQFIGLKTVVHSKNFIELEKMLDQCLNLEAFAFSYNTLRSEGRGQSVEPNAISELEIAKKMIPFLNLKKYNHLYNGTQLLFYKLFQSTEIVRPPSFYIDFDGSVYPDQKTLENEKIGNIKNKNLNEQFQLHQHQGQTTHIDENLFKYIQKNVQILS